MKNFTYHRVENTESAIHFLGQNANSKFLGGGTNLVDLMRENIEQPDALVDVSRLSGEITETKNGVSRGNPPSGNYDSPAGQSCSPQIKKAIPVKGWL